LPSGKDRTFLKTANRAAQAFLGGWQVGTVAMFQTGPCLTLTITGSSEQANLDLVSRQSLPRTDRIGSGNLDDPTPYRFFDIAAFTPTPTGAGRIGNSGVGILRGPGTIAIAGGVSKTFAVREGLRARFETTVTNLVNHANFTAPFVDVSTPATFDKTTDVQSAENSGQLHRPAFATPGFLAVDHE